MKWFYFCVHDTSYARRMIIKISHCIGIHVIENKYILCVFLNDVYLLSCFKITYEISGGGILLINGSVFISSPKKGGVETFHFYTINTFYLSIFICFNVASCIEDTTVSIQV